MRGRQKSAITPFGTTAARGDTARPAPPTRRRSQPRALRSAHRPRDRGSTRDVLLRPSPSRPGRSRRRCVSTARRRTQQRTGCRLRAPRTWRLVPSLRERGKCLSKHRRHRTPYARAIDRSRRRLGLPQSVRPDPKRGAPADGHGSCQTKRSTSGSCRGVRTPRVGDEQAADPLVPRQCEKRLVGRPAKLAADRVLEHLHREREDNVITVPRCGPHAGRRALAWRREHPRIQAGTPPMSRV